MTRLVGSFAEGGDDYERLRPSYPDAAVDLLAPGRGADVVDVGAGTGKLTRLLMARGHRVRAVEPSGAMRETLRRALPGVEVLPGTGEATGLPQGSADLVTYAQSWHWTDPERAGVEAARLLRPGGVLATVWNMFDDTVPWMVDVERAMHSSERAWQPGPDGGVAARGEPGGTFGPRRRDLVRWTDTVALDDLRLVVRTRSYYLEGTVAERRDIDHEVEQALARHFRDAPGGQSVEVPYVTTVDRYARG
ncbi:Methyltransferase [Serinicoccus hydrothermalis]|uniref:Methyltransferase n=1 Tax=Serinicoccus hydrothermalis TaxID=1758689 RepID=A0A1B1N8E5_9MICO|nr:class I SAM-dependent methyltransferase [Serinicoccus hydrothermalis]ANS77684.1 Methyltransferase [Serinicoccus hydrothermalis]